MAPRIHFGEHSDWYMGTRVDTSPTPDPAKKRPTMNMGRVDAPVCRAMPRENMTHATMMPMRRPTASATGPPTTAPASSAYVSNWRVKCRYEVWYSPTTVPAKRRETTTDSSAVGSSNRKSGPCVPETGSPNVLSQSSMRRIPEMVPVS